MQRFDKVDYLARLIRIELSDEERDLFSRQLSDILAYVDQLKEVNVEGVEPMYHAVTLTNRFRKDIVKPSLDRVKALANAPRKKDGFFVVPRVIEE